MADTADPLVLDFVEPKRSSPEPSVEAVHVSFDWSALDAAVDYAIQRDH